MRNRILGKASKAFKSVLELLFLVPFITSTEILSRCFFFIPAVILSSIFIYLMDDPMIVVSIIFSTNLMFMLRVLIDTIYRWKLHMYALMAVYTLCCALMLRLAMSQNIILIIVICVLTMPLCGISTIGNDFRIGP